MRLGCHLSIAKGFPAAVAAADALGINVLQIFSHSPSMWRMPPIPAARAEAFRARRAASGVEEVFVHAMYLLNLASPDDALYERSIAALTEEVQRAAVLSIDTVITHLGAHRGSGAPAGRRRIAAALDRVLAASVFVDRPDMCLLLENTAGAGTTLGARFGELGAILGALSDASRVGICLDTCHAFAAGYPFAPRRELEETLAAFDHDIGLSRLRVIHLNDSRAPLGSHRDRHAHIGEGEIGMAAFALLVNHPTLTDLPFVLETPKERIGSADADRINLARVRKLRRRGEGR